MVALWVNNAPNVQCPWRLEDGAGVITGSGDLYTPYKQSEQLEEPVDWEKGGSLQDGILRDLLRGYDENTKQIVNATDLLTVEAV